MKRIVGRLLQRVVVAVREGGGFRIVDRVERLGGVVRAHVTRQRRRSRRIVWDLAGITRQRRRSRRIVWALAVFGAAVVSHVGAGLSLHDALPICWMSSIGHSR